MPYVRRILHPSCTFFENHFQFQPRRTEGPCACLRASRPSQWPESLCQPPRGGTDTCLKEVACMGYLCATLHANVRNGNARSWFFIRLYYLTRRVFPAPPPSPRSTSICSAFGVSGSRNFFCSAVLDRWGFCLGPAVLLRLHGSAVRLDARTGDLWERAEQTHCRAHLRLPGRMGHRPLWASPRDDDRHIDGRHCVRRTWAGFEPGHVLFLFLFQRTRLRLWWPIAEPGSVDPLVRSITREGDGVCVSRHWYRGSNRPVDLAHAHRAFWMAHSTADSRNLDCGRVVSLCSSCARTANSTNGLRARIPELKSSIPASIVLLDHGREHVLDSCGQWHTAESKTLS